MDLILSSLTKALCGHITLAGDKSLTHRALILGALTPGTSEIINAGTGQDNRATLRCLAMMGVKFSESTQRTTIQTPTHWQTPKQPLDCQNSGTTMRMMAALCVGLRLQATLIGDESLSRRPMLRLKKILAQWGARIDCQHDHAPLVIHPAPLHATQVLISPPSAQLKSAAMLTALFADQPSTITESETTRDHTEKLLSALNFPIAKKPNQPNSYIVSPLFTPLKNLKSLHLEVPGDISSALFWVLLATLVKNSKIRIQNVLLNPTRTTYLRLLQQMGARISTHIKGQCTSHEDYGDIDVESAELPLKKIEISASDARASIDELPGLAIAMAYANGQSRVTGASALKEKECDRIVAITQTLSQIGIAARALDDGFEITGASHAFRKSLTSANKIGEFNSFQDHRIALMQAVLTLVTPGLTACIRDFDCTQTSYGNFMNDLDKITQPHPIHVSTATPIKGVIAIDGPAGAGKSTISRILATQLGYAWVNTGAIYRAVTLLAHQQGIAFNNSAALSEIAQALRIAFVPDPQGHQRVIVHDSDVTELISKPEISHATSIVASDKAVRDQLLGIQKQLAKRGHVVLEGRDIGTVVCPEAEFKFFLDASAETRAHRRLAELAAKGVSVDYVKVLADIVERDARDRTREEAPLIAAPDAHIIDSSRLTLDEVVQSMLTHIQKQPR